MCLSLRFSSIMIKTSGNCFYIVNLYFPCRFVNAFGLAVLPYRPSSFVSQYMVIYFRTVVSCFQIIFALNYVVQGVSEMEMNVVSVERVEEYTKLDPEVHELLLTLIKLRMTYNTLQPFYINFFIIPRSMLRPYKFKKDTTTILSLLFGNLQ